PDQPIRLVLNELTLDDPSGREEKKYKWKGHVAMANTKLQLGLEASNVTGLLALQGSHDGERLECEGNLQLDAITVATLQLKNLRSRVVITDDDLVLPGIAATLHDGQVYGPIRVRFGTSPEYLVDLSASRVDLESFAQQSLDSASHAKGRASAHL